MAVVFDEVIASVEAPPPAPDEGGEAMEMPMPGNDIDKIIRAVETRQRWANRLMAD